jgi:M6 family metalloprotease-like protein
MITLFIFPICCTTGTYPKAGSQNPVALSPIAIPKPTSVREQSQQPLASQSSPETGTLRVIVLLIGLSDATPSKSPSEINSTVFTNMASYYYNISYGELLITGITTRQWYNLTENTAYYGEDIGGQIDPNGWKLIRDAISSLNSSIDFAFYNTVIVVHSGQDQASSGVSNDIWSSYWYGLEIPTNGIVITSGIIVSEFDPVGIYDHEFGHSLGLPDLYDENRSVDDFVGDWDVMAEGAWLPNYSGTSPSSLCSWCKLKLGWIPSSAIDEGRNMSGVIDPLEIKATNFTVMMIPITTQAYYLVEVRQQIGVDSYVPSSGVLILYCDDSLTTGNGIVKVRSSHSLTDATYTQASGNNTYIDNSNNINITVLLAYSLSYEVSVKLIRPDHTPPSILIQNTPPPEWSTYQSALIQAKITDTGENSSGVRNASVVYSPDQGKSWNSIPMSPGPSDIYSATIPPQNSSEVMYYIEAYDYAGNLAVANNGGKYYVYGISQTVVVLLILVPVSTILVVIAVAFLYQKRKEEQTHTRNPDSSNQNAKRNH